MECCLKDLTKNLGFFDTTRGSWPTKMELEPTGVEPAENGGLVRWVAQRDFRGLHQELGGWRNQMMVWKQQKFIKWWEPAENFQLCFWKIRGVLRFWLELLDQKKTKMFWDAFGCPETWDVGNKDDEKSSIPQESWMSCRISRFKRLHLFACGKSSWSLHLSTKFRYVLHAVAHPQGALRRWVPMCFVL